MLLDIRAPRGVVVGAFELDWQLVEGEVSRLLVGQVDEREGEREREKKKREWLVTNNSPERGRRVTDEL